MIEKVEKVAIQFRFLFLALFILMTIVSAICCADEEVDRSELSFWPPDMVPHPPHFPQEPQPPTCV